MDRVLVQKAEAVAKTKGGILIPEKAQSKVKNFKFDWYKSKRSNNYVIRRYIIILTSIP